MEEAKTELYLKERLRFGKAERKIKASEKNNKGRRGRRKS